MIDIFMCAKCGEMWGRKEKRREGGREEERLKEDDKSERERESNIQPPKIGGSSKRL